MCKCVFSLKPDIFTVFPINSISKLKKKKIQHIISEMFIKKNSLRNLTKFRGGLFELEILENFTTSFLLKAII